MQKIKSILKFAVGFLLTLIFFEFYFSLTEVSLTSKQIDQFELRPGSRMLEINEGLYMGEINEYGYLGPAYPHDKADNSIRIALLGDSYVEGFQLFDRHHFRKLIEEKLSGEINKPVEVLNFGRSGFDFFSMYAYYKKYVSGFSPDLIMFFIGANDFSEYYANWVTLDSTKSSPDIAIQSNQPARKNSMTKFLKGRFVLPPLLYKCSVLIDANQTSKVLLGKYDFFNTSKQNEISPAFHNSDIDFLLLDAVLSDLDLNPGYSSKPIVLFVVFEDIPDLVREKLNKTSKHLLDLKSEIKKQELAEYELNYWKATLKVGHWNHKGHKIIANYLTQQLRSIFLNY